MQKIFLWALLWLLAIGCKTQTITVQRPADPEKLAQVQTVEVNGERLHYIEQGEGEALILVHGTLGDYRAWTSRIEPYSEDYHVIAYSRRYAWPNEQEFDESADYSVRVHADDLYALIKKRNLEKVHIIGHSYGAYTALTMAIDHPEVVQSLVLGEPPAASLVDNSEAGRASREAFLQENFRPAAKAFRANKNEEALELFIQGVMGQEFRLAEVPPQVKQGWMDNLLELWGAALNESFLPLDPAAIAELKVPTLLVVGDRSPTWLIEVSKELHHLLPNSRLETLTDSSHGLMFEQPEAFDGMVQEFLSEN